MSEHDERSRFVSRRTFSGAVSGVVAVAVSALGMSHGAPAQAAFPGNDGVIAFAAGDITTIRPDGGIVTVLTNTDQGNSYESNYSPTFSADGERIAFLRDIGNASSNYQIFVMNEDGSGAQQLTHGFPGGFELLGSTLSFSPNGKKLAFARSRRAGQDAYPTEIYSMNVTGSGVRRLTHQHPCGSCGDSDAVYSPSGATIAFVRSYVRRHEVVSGIFTMHADGSHIRMLTSTRGHPPGPIDYSPDGRMIAFVQGRYNHRTGKTGRAKIYLMHANGSHIHLLTKRPLQVDTTGSNGIAFSPLGDRLAFVSRVRGDFELTAIGVNGSDLRRLATLPTDTGIDWQPE